MSAALLSDRSESKVAPTETGYLAPVLPIRRSAPAPAPTRPARRPVGRRAGSRGPRYLPASTPTTWQLSRRGELLLRRVTALVTAVVVVLVLTAGVFAVVRAVGSSPVPTRTISVQPGQSLWQVAAATSPGADVGDTVSQIRSLNHLGDTMLTPGQTLLVPATR
jgi:LysM repeat protein